MVSIPVSLSYGDAVHQRQVDHHAVVTDRVAREVVSAAPHRDGQIAAAREIDRGSDVGVTAAADDRAGPAIEPRVPDPAGGVVLRVAGG